MAEQTAQPTAFKAKITTVISTQKDGVTPLVKTRANGETARYDLCGATITEGPLKGKGVWAQRTLMNRDGKEKAAVAVNDEVNVIVSVVDGKPLFEVSTGAINATDAEILAALGMAVETPAEEVKAGV